MRNLVYPIILHLGLLFCLIPLHAAPYQAFPPSIHENASEITSIEPELEKEARTAFRWIIAGVLLGAGIMVLVGLIMAGVVLISPYGFFTAFIPLAILGQLGLLVLGYFKAKRVILRYDRQYQQPSKQKSYRRLKSAKALIPVVGVLPILLALLWGITD